MAPRPITLIAVASGSDDVDVIVTSSVLSRMGHDVVIASAAGWSPVTLRSGLVVKPTSSLDRALDCRKKRFFDILLLPDGDEVSVGRLGNHARLPAVVKDVARKMMKGKDDEEIEPSIVFAGRSARLFHLWNLHMVDKPGLFTPLITFLRTWFISKAEGANIILPYPQYGDSLMLLCSPSPNDDPLQTVRTCAARGKVLALNYAKKVELESYGLKKFSMLESMRKDEDATRVSDRFRNFFEYLRDSSRVPYFIRKFCLSPICSTLRDERPRMYHLGKLYPGMTKTYDEIRNSHSYELNPTKNSAQLLAQSSGYITGSTLNFIQESFRFCKRQLPMCRAAVLVTNRVSEQLLAVLVKELRSNFKIMTRVIACDRGVLKTRDPFIITLGMLQIRCDGMIENLYPDYDVIITLDSEVYYKGPGMWYRKSTFSWDDFETIRKRSYPPGVSCVAAAFDNENGCAHAIELVTRKRFNPLTNEWITLENMLFQEPLVDAKFFDVCSKTVWKKDGFHKERANHDLVFQSFKHLHDRGDMHTTISDESCSQEALDFARAVTDCLRQRMSRNGHAFNSLPSQSRCVIL